MGAGPREEGSGGACCVPAAPCPLLLSRTACQLVGQHARARTPVWYSSHCARMKGPCAAARQSQPAQEERLGEQRTHPTSPPACQPLCSTCTHRRVGRRTALIRRNKAATRSCHPPKPSPALPPALHSPPAPPGCKRWPAPQSGPWGCPSSTRCWSAPGAAPARRSLRREARSAQEWSAPGAAPARGHPAAAHTQQLPCWLDLVCPRSRASRAAPHRGQTAGPGATSSWCAAPACRPGSPCAGRRTRRRRCGTGRDEVRGLLVIHAQRIGALR